MILHLQVIQVKKGVKSYLIFYADPCWGDHSDEKNSILFKWTYTELCKFLSLILEPCKHCALNVFYGNDLSLN